MTSCRTPPTMLRQPPEGLFARLLDSLTDMYALVLNQDQRVTYANLSFLDHFELSWEQISGRPCQDLGTHFLDADSRKAGFCPNEMSPWYPARTLLTREVLDRVYRYDATLYRLEGLEGTSWSIWSLRDVTDRFRLESQVRRLDELERSLVQASMDGIIVNDMLGNVLIFNDGAAKIMGYTPQEVIGKIKVSRLYPGKTAHEIKRLIYDPTYGGVGILENYETMALHKEGFLIPIWLSARLLHEDSQEVGIVGYFRDLRERKRLEIELLRNERLATLGQMVARISHEIKNPLATIGGFARRVAALAGLPEEARRKLILIQKEAQRLERFLTDMGTFTLGGPPQKTMGDILSLIREVEELMDSGFKERSITFRLQPQFQVPTFAFDPGHIRQVLINLFKNSLEAMPRGGELSVVAEIEGDHLVLRISDTGTGITPEQMRHLFTPFFSTKKGGTGLGLTIVRGLISQHRGEISIESEVGRGTTYIIRLPLA
ncbi:MAG TPA: ATP-binding protein, partial [Desulfobaccales bacterium]|nr:ATP-binding protein [Desulfobaccales bacterium]